MAARSTTQKREMAAAIAVGGFNNCLSNYATYEEYLDSKLTPVDLFYLKKKEFARKLVEHGQKGPVLSRKEFEEKKAAAHAADAAQAEQAAKAAKRSLAFQSTPPRTLASAGKEFRDSFLRALAAREEANRSGKTTSVIFIRDHNTLGQEVSGYIDYAHRLKTQDFEPFFSGKTKLMPGPSDLCFYNWKTQVSTSNCSPNFEVLYESPDSLLFKNRRDKKILNVDPLSGPGEDSTRTVLQSDLYVHVVIYDHNIRTV